MKKKLLVVEPHSDDGLIAVGGFLEKNRDRYDYYFVLAVCSAIPLNHNNHQTREARLSEFKNYVDYFEGEWLQSDNTDIDLPLDKDAELDMYPKKLLVKQIETVVGIVKPDVVMCTGPSFHQDHTAVYEALIAATRPTALHYPDEFYILENPTYVHSSGPMTKFIPDTYVALTEHEVDMKVELFRRLFPSQIRDEGNALSGSGIKSWARYRGIEARSEFAEALQTFSRILR